jgi:hypothetical protein
MHRILEWSPVVFAFAFIFAFDAWQAEREKRKRAERERDWRRADARDCVKLLREANAVLVELANSAGECGRLLAAWNMVVARPLTDEASGLTLTITDTRHGFDMAHKHDAEALDRLNGTLARFHEYAERNNLAITERTES